MIQVLFIHNKSYSRKLQAKENELRLEDAVEDEKQKRELLDVQCKKSAAEVDFF